MKSAQLLKPPQTLPQSSVSLAFLCFPLLVCLDIVIISAAFFWGSHLSNPESRFSWQNAFFFAALGPIVFSFCKVYRLQWQALFQIVSQLLGGTLLLIFLQVLLKYSFPNSLAPLFQTGGLFITASGIFFACSINHLCYRKLLQWGFRRGLGLQHVLLAGNASLLDRKEHFLLQGIHLSEACTPNVENIQETLKRAHFDRIVLYGPELPAEEINHIYQQASRQGVELWLQPDVHQLFTSRQQLDEMAGVPVIKLQRTPLHHPLHRALKRSLDLVIATSSLILLSPILLLLALSIRLDSSGPIFYRQTRISRNGKAFEMLKFRTMCVDSEIQSGPVWASSNDPRTTRVGRWLRRASLDELPQLFNVLFGSMSFVGPRPERPHFVSQFEQEILNYPDRHLVKAGMTGWAQVNGWRGDTSIEERTRCDLYYIENWSLFLDLRIIARSFITVIQDYFEHRAY